MATRRRAPETAPALVIPPELTRCDVEDWTSALDVEPDRNALLMLAYGRFRQARREFLTGHDVPRRLWGQVLPGCAPRWREDARSGT